MERSSHFRKSNSFKKQKCETFWLEEIGELCWNQTASRGEGRSTRNIFTENVIWWLLERSSIERKQKNMPFIAQYLTRILLRLRFAEEHVCLGQWRDYAKNCTNSNRSKGCQPVVRALSITGRDLKAVTARHNKYEPWSIWRQILPQWTPAGVQKKFGQQPHVAVEHCYHWRGRCGQRREPRIMWISEHRICVTACERRSKYESMHSKAVQ